jgi:RNA polymerase sigma factor (sigma-70 family)
VEANAAETHLRKTIMAAFYNAYYEYTYKIALKKWKLPEMEAENMLYEVFFKLLNPRIVQLLRDTPQNFNRYMEGIIRNEAFKWYAVKKQQPPLVLLTDEIYRMPDEIEADSIQIKKIEHLRNYLKSLSPECQELIMIKYQNKDGEDKVFLKEKAAEWGISEEAMRQRKKRCTDDFKKNYNPMTKDE